ncbi:MAG TPA: hypothetical protein VMM13_16370 [Euzebya sp.]|nr:hypothetical protein [Euzebya sp.]
MLGAVVLFAPSLWGGATPVPTDILHGFAPWSQLPAADDGVANPLLRDVIDTYHPEQTTIWDRLLGPGDADWVEGAGMGSPGWWFVGTAALSPFVVLATLSGPGIGPALGIIARLTLAGAGIGLAARRWGVSRAGAVLAAGCFAFSGFMVAWLGWPQTHVAAMVGWVWWATTVCARRGTPWWGVAALGIATAAAWFGGFPAIAALLVLSGAGLAVAEAYGRDGDRLVGLLRCAAGLGVGTLLAAVQLLPSLAYLGVVDLAARGEAWRGSLPVHLLARWVAPDMFGDGVGVAYWGRINLIETAAHVGVPALVLAVAAVLWRIREGAVRRVAVLAAVTGALAYGLPPLLQVIRVIPGLNTNPPARGVVLTAAAVALLAGFGLDAVRNRPGRPDRAGVLTIVATGGVVAVALVISGSVGQITELADMRLVDPATRAAARTLVWASLAQAALLVGLSLLLIVAVRGLGSATAADADTTAHDPAAPDVGDARATAPRGLAVAAERARATALVVLVVLSLADPFAAAVGWNTQRPAEELYPVVPALTRLAEAVPPPGRVAAASGVLLPMTDLRYGYDDARGRRFTTAQLRAAIEAAGGAFSSPTRWDLQADPSTWTAALGALGVQGVVRRPHEPLPPIPALTGDDQALGPVPAGRTVSRTTTIGARTSADGPTAAHHTDAAGPNPGDIGAQRPVEVSAVVLRIGTYGREAAGDLVVSASAGAQQRRGALPAAPLVDGQLVEVALDDPLPVAPGQAVTVDVTTTASGEGQALTVFGDADGVAASLRTRPAWQATDLGGLILATVPDATPWLSLASTVQATPGDQVPAALAEDHSPSTVHLSPDLVPVPTGPDARITSSRIEGRDITVEVHTPHGAVLRVLDAHLPGWSARVDGVPADVVAADGAFVGVVLPPGTTAVRLQWRAPWLTTGQVVSVLAALVLLAWTAQARRRSRGRPISAGDATA